MEKQTCMRGIQSISLLHVTVKNRGKMSASYLHIVETQKLKNQNGFIQKICSLCL